MTFALRKFYYASILLTTILLLSCSSTQQYYNSEFENQLDKENALFELEIPDSCETYLFHGEVCHSPKKIKESRNSNYLTVYTSKINDSLPQIIKERLKNIKDVYEIFDSKISQFDSKYGQSFEVEHGQTFNTRSSVALQHFYQKEDIVYILYFEALEKNYSQLKPEVITIFKSFSIR